MSERRVDVTVVRWYERRGARPIVPRRPEAAHAHLPAAITRTPVSATRKPRLRRAARIPFGLS
ncbi:hypothetical protein [Nocardia bovistercoris]|uniref:Uncharacterized protein n=1 Tax=Nocardia bovistercoris TaxID=2785916 RepID=A0A931ICB6_9NOCA|nr:hypothetical protein [Nocardia bovistercoris]MBH0777898.1 hypothetical protein [Nocardia bovistercoris]